MEKESLISWNWLGLSRFSSSVKSFAIDDLVLL